VTPLRAAFETLVAGRDRLAVAIAALSPLLDGESLVESAPPAASIAATGPVKALPAGRRKQRAAKAVPKPKGTRRRKSATGRRGISDETIAKIQALDAKGKPQTEIAEACGVSIPTVKKYADAAPVAPTNSDKPAPVVAAKTDPRTGRPWI